MSLIEEIQEKKKKLEKSASEKDQVFSRFISGEKITIPDTDGMTDALKICYSAFSGNNSEQDLVKEVQRSKPVREGFHYSNNLVELMAVAKHDFEGEKENLQIYSDSHNAKEAFLIKKVFPKINYKTPLKVETTIDQLVKDVLIEHNLDNGEDKILNAVKDANDLLDVYLIDEALTACYKLHPSTKDRDNIKYLLTFYIRVHKILHTVLSLLFYGSLLGTLVYGTYLLTPYIVSNWDSLEPHIFIIQTVSPLGLILVLAALQWKLNVREWIKPLQEKIVFIIESLIFRMIGMNLSEILKIHSVFSRR